MHSHQKPTTCHPTTMNTHLKSEGFDVLTEIYSVVDGHPIPTDIFVPISLPEGHHCPVIVRIHGGFLVCPLRSECMATAL